MFHSPASCFAPRFVTGRGEPRTWRERASHQAIKPSSRQAPPSPPPSSGARGLCTAACSERTLPGGFNLSRVRASVWTGEGRNLLSMSGSFEATTGPRLCVGPVRRRRRQSSNTAHPLTCLGVRCLHTACSSAQSSTVIHQIAYDRWPSCVSVDCRATGPPLCEEALASRHELLRTPSVSTRHSSRSSVTRAAILCTPISRSQAIRH